jgi:hypothetical protein
VQRSVQERYDAGIAVALAIMLGARVPLWPATVQAQATPPPDVRVVAACDFEGPYITSGEHQILAGCDNNWVFGRKDMLIKAEQDAGRPGTSQSIHVRGIAAGEVQFLYTKLALKKDRHYRVSWWMKGEGMEGPLWAQVRKVGSPWTPLVWGWSGFPTAEWRRYSFTSRCPEDTQVPIGVEWHTGALGKFWLDDLLVEESDQPFAEASAAAPAAPPAGNLLPRSSCEGRRDPLWSTGVQGSLTRWREQEPAWEDPQAYRAEGGKFGKYCMAIPASTRGGDVFCHSFYQAVIPGQTYTFSAWLRADRDNMRANIGAGYSSYFSGGWSEGYPFGNDFTVGREWQRYSVSGVIKAVKQDQIWLQIAPFGSNGTLFVDGLQLEASTNATPYKPRYPLELYADVGQPFDGLRAGAGGNLFDWGQRVPLTVLAAAADTAAVSRAKVEIKVVGYPDVLVWRKVVNLSVNKETHYNLALDRRGIFRVELRTVDAGLAAPQELVLALLPPPRPTGAASLFGTHITVRPFFIQYARRLGFNWTRLHGACGVTKWECVEHEPGVYDWNEAQVNALCKAGWNVLGLVDDPPVWARIASPTNHLIRLDAFARYCEAMARHYRGRIDHWEVWNEPYNGNPDGFQGTPEQFGDILKAAYPAFKRGNPDCKVVGPCAEISGVRFSERLPADARRCVDIFSFHQYMYNVTGGGTLPFADSLPDHRRLFAPAGVTECWNTEGNNGDIGFNSFYTFLPTTPALNDLALAFASRVWIETAKAGVAKFFVFMMYQSDAVLHNYGTGSWKNLIGFDRSVTLGAVATAVTAHCIDGLKTRPCASITGVVQGLFAGGDRATWVVYDDGGVTGRKTLDLTKLPRRVHVLDVMGNDPRRDGVKTWEIGQVPLFVMSPKLSADELAVVGRAAIRE